MILTTQIGSLPFKSIAHAVDYALGFDLPFIPTIPKFNFNELMIELVLRGFQKQDYAPKELCFFNMLERLKGKTCKYQVIGPISLHFYLKSKDIDCNYFDLENYLIKKIQVAVDLIEKHLVEPVIFIDEPCLEFYDDFPYEKLHNFFSKLQGFRKGLHSCCDIDFDKICSLDFQMLSYDCLKYGINQLENMNLINTKELLLGVFSTDDDLNHDKMIINLLKDINIKMGKFDYYMTPTCGLGLSKEKRAYDLASKNIEQYLIKDLNEKNFDSR